MHVKHSEQGPVPRESLISTIIIILFAEKND